jgi:hypothetical protein
MKRIIAALVAVHVVVSVGFAVVVTASSTKKYSIDVLNIDLNMVKNHLLSEKRPLQG